MAENMDIGINITGNAQQQLSKIQKQVDQVSNSFETMKTVLGSLAIGAMIQQVGQFADEITDTAAAFGVATSEVLALSAALGASGGKGENAIKIFQGISTSIDELNNGNLKTLQSFEQLGLSLSELGQMSESEIRDKVIVELGEMTNKTEASALAMKMFGKAAIGVDFTKLADEIKNNQEEAKKFAGAIDTAGEAFDNMAKLTKQLKLAFADAFEPAFNLISQIKVDTETLSTTFKVLGVAILSIATAITAVRIATSAATTAMVLFNTVSSANPWVLGAKAIIAGLTAAGILIATNTDEQKASNTEADKSAEITNKNVVKTQELNNKLKQQREEVMKISKEYQNTSNALKNQYDLILSSQRLSAIEFQQQKAMNDLQLKFTNDLRTAKQDFDKLDVDSQERQRQAYFDNVKAINEQYDIQRKITAERIYDEQLIKAQTDSQMTNSNIQIDNLKTMAKMRSDAEGLIQTTRERVDQEAALKSYLETINILQKEINSSAFLTTDEKKKYLDVVSKIKSVEEGLKVAGQLELTTHTNITDQIIKQNDALAQQAELTSKINENAKTFSAGWTQAFNQYVENGTNAARIAGDMFNSTTRNMESAIDRFVETGKFNFSDFTRSVIQDLLKIQLKAQMTQLIKAASGGSGGFLGSLLGFAEGGQPPINKPSIVGEKGPELFVPKTAGTIVPNGGSMNGNGMSQQPTNNTYITNNISALDSRSVAQMFAENRKTLLGTVQLAQKEMPYSNR